MASGHPVFVWVFLSNSVSGLTLSWEKNTDSPRRQVFSYFWGKRRDFFLIPLNFLFFPWSKFKFTVTVISTQLKNQHLLWRAGFGPMAEDSNQLATASPKSLFKALQKASSKSPAYLEVADNMLKGLMMGVDDLSNMQKKDLSEEQKKQIHKH
jgi:hypothetical protein